MSQATILDAIATRIATLRSEAATIKAWDDFLPSPEQVVLDAQLDGLHVAFSHWCLEYIAGTADSIAHDRGFTSFDLCVWRAASHLRNSGFTRAEFVSRSVESAARTIARFTAILGDRDTTLRWVRQLGGDMDTYAFNASAIDGDPRRTLAGWLDGLLDQSKEVQVSDEEIEIVPDSPTTMTGRELADSCDELHLSLGQLGRIVGAADRSTPRRWKNGERAVPASVALLVNAMKRHSGVRGYFIRNSIVGDGILGHGIFNSDADADDQP